MYIMLSVKQLQKNAFVNNASSAANVIRKLTDKIDWVLPNISNTESDNAGSPDNVIVRDNGMKYNYVYGSGKNL